MKNKLWALLALFLFYGTIHSQDDIDIKLSSTYAIQGAHIIQKPGQSIEKGTVVIKNGVILDVGTNVEIPPEAILVKADSMYVYPGFIDAYNELGVKKKEDDKKEERIKNPGNPPNDRAGITPDRSLMDVFDEKDKNIESWREAGFTASMSAPSDGTFPGMASILLHSGKDVSQAILIKDFGQVGTFQSANRMYPATIIGVMAKYRDIMRQASYATKHQQAYKASPVGMSRPAYDKSITALIPIAEKSQTMYMETPKFKDVSRALNLQQELGFKMALVNVKQGSDYIDIIKSQNIPVVLSMELPESDEKKKDEKKDDEKKEKTDEKEDEVKEEIDPEMEALKARREESIKEYQAQAAMFAKNGVAFGLSGKGIKGKDVQKNAKLMIDQGITEDQLLAALTINPAKMYGVSNIMGTVEKGKMANLMVTTAPYFSKDAKVKYVFVEGEQFEYEVKEKKKKKSGEAVADMSGKYSYVIQVPGEPREGNIIIKKSDDSYTVSFGDSEGNNEEVDAEIDGNNISFPFTTEDGGYSIDLEVDFTIEDEELEGSVKAGQFGSFPIKGERIGDPDKF